MLSNPQLQITRSHPNSERDISIDIFRIVGAVAVTIIHVSFIFGTRNSNLSLIYSFSLFAIPLFIFLSGFSLTLNDEKRGEMLPLGSYLSRRLKKVVIPFLIWSSIYEVESYLIYYIHENNLITFPDSMPVYSNFDLASVVINVITGNVKGHLYYILVIIQFYLVYLLLYKKKWYMDTKILLLAFVVSLGCALVGGKFVDMTLLQSIFIPWTFYFVLGMWMAHKGDTMPFKYSKVAGLAIFAVGAALIIYQGLTRYRFGNIELSVFLYSLGFILLIFNGLHSRLNDKTESKIVKPLLKKYDGQIAFLGENAFGVYLMNMLIIDGIWAFSSVFLNGMFNDSLFFGSMITIAIIIVSYSSIYLGNKYLKAKGLLW